MSKPATIVSAKEVAQDITATMQVAQEQAKVLSKPNDTKEVEVIHEAKQKEADAKQKEALKEAVTVSNTIKKDRIQRRTREEKAADKIQRNLEAYATSPIGAVAKMVALQRVLETITQFPVNSNFNLLLDFFKTHKNAEFLKEENALQNIAVLPSDARLKIEMLYHVLYSIVRGEASKNTISLNALRSVFRSDNLINWVSSVMRDANRR